VPAFGPKWRSGEGGNTLVRRFRPRHPAAAPRQLQMPLSTDVRLPRNIVPVFPDACCSCGRDHPGDHILAKGRRVRFIELFLPWLWFFGKRVKLEVPVCAACRPEVLATRRWMLVVLVVAGAIASYFVFPWVKSLELGRGMTKLVSLGAVVGAIAPLWIYWVFHPPKFDLTVFRDHVDYEFASADYARRFAECNPGAIFKG
jgi:fatty acid desaturase